MLIDVSPLKNVEFRRLFLSQAISMLGTQMTLVTIPFQVYALTDSTFHTGLVSSVELVCLIATVFWGGALADKADRRRLLIVSECLMAIFVAILAFNATLPSPSLAVLYIVAGVLAAIGGFHRPAFEALTPLLVPKGDLAKVSALTMFKMVIASLLGPTVGGFFVSSIGPVLTYSLNVLTFAVSLLFLMALRTPLNEPGNVSQDAGDEKKGLSTILREIGDGVAFLRKRRDILGSYLVDFSAMVFCMPQVLFPAFAEEYGQTRYLGALYAAVAGGGFMAAMFSGWTPRVKRLGIAIALAAGGWAISIVSAGVFQGFWFLAAGLFFAGAFDGFSGIFRLTMWNESIPQNFRGRLASFGMLSYMSGPLLGNTLMGFLASEVGLHLALVIGGSVSLAMVVFAGLRLPQFRAYDSSNWQNVSEEGSTSDAAKRADAPRATSE